MENYRIIDYKYDRAHLASLVDGIKFTSIDKTFLTEEKTKEIQKFLGIRDIEYILYFNIFYKRGVVHVDNQYNGKICTWALNLPLGDLSLVRMNWYTANDGIEIKDNNNHRPRTDFTLKESITCNEPAIVKIDDWHSAENDSSPAVLLSIRFYNAKTIDDVLMQL